MGIDGPMKFRKLRIAWSVVCGVACVLLIALWVRSYRARELVCGLIGNNSVLLQSVHGEIGLSIQPWTAPRFDKIVKSDPQAPQVSLWQSAWQSPELPGISVGLGIRWWRSENGVVLATIPHWCPVIALATLAAIPWIRQKWRFSLRTLLIATTLVAVVLGMIVWSVR
jgi:hypothetical protein